MLNKLLEDFTPKNKNKNKNKLAIIICGGPATGKTTLRNELIKKYKLENNYFLIDPDEYLKYFDNDYEKTSNITKKEIESFVINNEYNIIYDKVFSYIKDLKKLINELKKNKYRIIFYLTYININKALERNTKRIRKVPENIIKSRFNEIKNNGLEYLNLNVDEIYLYSYNELIYYKNNTKDFYFKL